MVKVEASAAGPLPSPALLWCFRRPGHAAQAHPLSLQAPQTWPGARSSQAEW